MRRFCLALALCLVFALTAHADRVALVIGNAEYDRADDLPQTRNDARDIAAELEGLGFTLVGGRAHLDKDRSDMLDLVRDFADAVGPGDEAVFYFSGHGIGASQTNYLLPADDDDIETREDVPDFAVDVSRITARLPRTGGGTVVIILDACRDNPLPSRAKSAYAAKGLTRVPRGAANAVFLYAAEPGEKAYVSAGRNSYFTAALMEALDVPGRDLTGIIRAVRQDVYARTRDRAPPQTPWFEGVADRPFYFNRAGGLLCGGLYNEAAVRDLWQEQQARRDHGALRDFARRCDDSRFAEPARDLAAAIDASATEPVPPPPDPDRPGETFRDPLSGGGQGPEMVVIPSGSFRMGSPSSEAGRDDDEGPQRTVRIGYEFAVGKYEVTRAQFERFVTETGYDAGDRCRTYEDGSWDWRDGLNWRQPGFAQTGNQPVVCVDWNAATAFADWLSRKTGEDYRLLSEAELEYAARAGTKGRYSNDGREAELCAIANAADRSTGFRWRNTACSDGIGEQTAPVGSFLANGFGLQDMHGNVWEWVQDCYADSYEGAPTDGSVRRVSECSRRVLRGGSWGDDPQSLRSANRGSSHPTDRLSVIGFRVARTLSPPTP